MAFPDVPRVLYEINPLVEVVCKLQFPPVLRIDEETPVAFQDQVRGEYPYYELKSTVKLPANLPPSLAKAVHRDYSLVGSKSYGFVSADRVWSLTLGRDALSLSCCRYHRWEEFSERLKRAFEALLQVYEPAFFSHVCLRYRNVVRRSRLQLEDTPWSELLQPRITGPLGETSSPGEVESIQTRCVIRLPAEGSRVDASYGLAVEEPGKELVFLIEPHLYTEPHTEPSDVFQTLVALNRQARLFFRWCITDKLHRSMRPSDVPLAPAG
jgi:uncharacterized protein (TIGR04255 family)